jgi:hypothetical protein
MTPEEEQTLKAHADSIAAILYCHTDPETLNTLEDIEHAVRQHMLKHVSPHVGTFLSEKRHNQTQGNPAPSKVVSELSKSPKNKRKQ